MHKIEEILKTGQVSFTGRSPCLYHDFVLNYFIGVYRGHPHLQYLGGFLLSVHPTS
jgi:hypothetical protein